MSGVWLEVKPWLVGCFTPVRYAICITHHSCYSGVLYSDLYNPPWTTSFPGEDQFWSSIRKWGWTRMIAAHIWVVIWGDAVDVTLCIIHTRQTHFMHGKTLMQQWGGIWYPDQPPSTGGMDTNDQLKQGVMVWIMKEANVSGSNAKPCSSETTRIWKWGRVISKEIKSF